MTDQDNAVLRALKASGIRVKPLEWGEVLRGRWIGAPVTKFGDLAFWIFRHHDGTFKRATKDGWQYKSTIEAAKAAAQAEYEARIIAVLDVTPGALSNNGNPSEEKS